jgi:dephospho-CoA kinase
MNKFIACPKIYLKKAPEMPKKFRLLIAGHEGSGKKTMANLLEKKYGWRVSDWKAIVANRIQELKLEYENEHSPNNPAAEDR